MRCDSREIIPTPTPRTHGNTLVPVSFSGDSLWGLALPLKLSLASSPVSGYPTFLPPQYFPSVEVRLKQTELWFTLSPTFHYRAAKLDFCFTRMMTDLRPRYPSNKLTFVIADLTKENTSLYLFEFEFQNLMLMFSWRIKK